MDPFSYDFRGLELPWGSFIEPRSRPPGGREGLKVTKSIHIHTAHLSWPRSVRPDGAALAGRSPGVWGWGGCILRSHLQTRGPLSHPAFWFSLTVCLLTDLFVLSMNQHLWQMDLF